MSCAQLYIILFYILILFVSLIITSTYLKELKKLYIYKDIIIYVNYLYHISLIRLLAIYEAYRARYTLSKGQT